MYCGRALYGQQPSKRNACPADPSLMQNEEEEADEREEREERERYAEGWADAHADDDETENDR